ncbi:hypothetical protein GCM10010377_61710 [Streptomyces viridiviolaceus]|uniref:Histidinol dehydrogenase n=1 Tax=Streptomyces viridiviolaceus TaxID=68282 RepID=A0ABW2ECQ2_9ACTN|nr:histidinol dehydrogenase [Streptomyces viridiviolaceus]GHB62224.1 hypothetical protein GCM10010377_61710 [Streptomyces viridiviolaceus]
MPSKGSTEHSPDSPAALITASERVATAVRQHVEEILPGLQTGDIAGPACRDHGQIILADDLDEAYRIDDSFAYEHVRILTGNPCEALDKMHAYGALFLGEGTCVSYGDKVIGTNHVLPTRGAARCTGGLWVSMYLRTVTYQEVREPRLCGTGGSCAAGPPASSCSRAAPAPVTCARPSAPAPR